MSKKASWRAINQKVGTLGSPPNKCPNKAAILAAGRVNIIGSYSNNQLVSLADIEQIDFNFIQIAYEIIGGTTVRISAQAAKQVASNLIISGTLVVSPSYYTYSYSLELNKYNTAGYWDLGLNYYPDSVTFETAWVNPSVDEKYRYEIIYQAQTL